MKLIKEYLNELKSLKADEVSGRSVTNISNSFYAKARDNKLGSQEELDKLLFFMMDINETARAYSRSKKNNTSLENELKNIDMHFNFDKATQKELREKMAETFKEVFKI